MNLTAGTKLGEQFEVLRPITSGGMGSIYEGRELRSNTRVAIKQMLEHLMEGEQAALFRSKFDAEVEFLRSLNHPGIPKLYTSFVLHGVYYIVMEFIVGRNLDQELEERLQLTGQPFPIEQIIRDSRQVLDILGYLHAQTPPLLHRDIKPANLIREHPSGRIKLVDFGMARLLDDQATQTQLGTLGYSPLEQLQGKAEQRSDLYALGATMHHLVTGVVPTVLNIPRVQQLRPDLDPALASIIDRACATDLNVRFPSSQAMLQALDELRPHLPVNTDSSLRISSLPRIDESRSAELGPPPVGANSAPLVGLTDAVEPMLMAEPPMPPLLPRRGLENRISNLQETVEVAPNTGRKATPVAAPPAEPEAAERVWSPGRQMAMLVVLSTLAFVIGWGVGHPSPPKSPTPSPTSPTPQALSQPVADPQPEVSQTPTQLLASPTSTPTAVETPQAPAPAPVAPPPVAPPPTAPTPSRTPKVVKAPPKPAVEPEEDVALSAPSYPTAARNNLSQGSVGLINTDSRVQIDLDSEWSSLGGFQQSRSFHRSFRKQDQGREFSFDIKGYVSEHPVSTYRNSFRADHQSWTSLDNVPRADLAFIQSQGRTHRIEALQAKLGHYYWYRFAGSGPGLDAGRFRQEFDKAWEQVGIRE